VETWRSYDKNKLGHYFGPPYTSWSLFCVSKANCWPTDLERPARWCDLVVVHLPSAFQNSLLCQILFLIFVDHNSLSLFHLYEFYITQFEWYKTKPSTCTSETSTSQASVSHIIEIHDRYPDSAGLILLSMWTQPNARCILPLATALFQRLLHRSGTVCRSQSGHRRCCKFSAADWKAHFLPGLTDMTKNVSLRWLLLRDFTV